MYMLLLEGFEFINGDCNDILKTLPSVDMILTDPPYGTTNATWDKALDFGSIWSDVFRICSGKKVCAFFGASPFDSLLVSSQIEKFRYDWIWEKPQATGHLNAKLRPMRAHERILIFSEYPSPTYFPQKLTGQKRAIGCNKPHNNNTVYRPAMGIVPYDSTERYPRSVLKFTADRQVPRYNPTQKPIDLLEYLIKTYTNEGETVLDFCMGGGSTAIACYNTGRYFIGVEKDEAMFNGAVTRFNKLIGN